MISSKWVLFFPLTVFLFYCSDSSNRANVDLFFDPAVTDIQIEVDYMTGAAPYTNNTTEGDPIWDFFKNNVTALFNNQKNISVPTSLSHMEEIPAQNKNYTLGDIVDLSKQYRNTPEHSGAQASLHILFLDGYLEEEGTAIKNVIGVSISNTTILALFKPVITSGSFSTLLLRVFTEQSVLIHEFGHAIGLVNNGLPITSAHHDSSHGAHCTNDTCVMYYLNEGSEELRDFLTSGNASIEKVIYGDECLNDAKALLTP